ncbi:DMT family transporter [Clostridium omnivorum]|uniref:EamA family transporter n=1 Tax=Clostridium omnivorum TaxID=1604902 RepID=A0ABQ5N0W1_9CLOT|nr:DMT family transporter [Clostridium sp. E14]GLC28843.1 EamA family transporter [Clostridium sp. E14]
MKKGYIYSILSAILFGSAGLVIKFAYVGGIDSISLLTLQYIIAVVIMFIVLYIMDKKALKVNRNVLLHCAILGIVGNTFMTIFYYLAFKYLPVAMVAILLYTYPIMVFLYSFIFEKEKVDLKKFIALLMAFSGCVLALGLIGGKTSYSKVGIIYGVLSALFYAFMNIYSEKKLAKVDSLTINFYSTLFSLISLIIYRVPVFVLKGEVSISLIGYTTILAVLCEILPLTLLYAAIKRIGSLKVSIIGNLEIPTAMILSYIFLHETITFSQLIGAVFVFYAVYKIRS